ncbi:hypothetical protein FE407_08485 [Leuconostoc carnosum]|uniref:hypothetical protein n=1 Tax=Leuconostoc TaxID=1243 RepID=UPI0004617F76|nr:MULTISPECIES: hypothetical protein [Leuconostoc]KDA51394.1 hypothetical protein L963_1574 [Leuconostoc mesenteroides subsp. cremoris T26]KAA8358034.1 hypothetical protein FE407_08485 [Leuconostoc carnosum]KAA8364429.1 hypothetical protein FE406_08725 [Leuconostoc carnosum]KAA8381420.1 hypothetical protein FD956_03815 [Leuconostoc carnosum]MCT8391987.1 hypothetical protein [Leuconostoc mesenteroides]
MTKFNLKWVYAFVLTLACLFLVQQALGYQRTVKSVTIVHQEIKATKAKSSQYSVQAKQLDKVKTADIRDTQNIEKIGNTFLKEMFAILPKLNKSDAKSSVATDDVVSAFLGATFGGDVDEGVPTFHLESNDIVYSKAADGSGLGFGTVKYQLGKEETSTTLLMHIENGKITELQTGAVKDTSGRK